MLRQPLQQLEWGVWQLSVAAADKERALAVPDELLSTLEQALDALAEAAPLEWHQQRVERLLRTSKYSEEGATWDRATAAATSMPRLTEWPLTVNPSARTFSTAHCALLTAHCADRLGSALWGGCGCSACINS